jgi:hypothetical protein
MERVRHVVLLQVAGAQQATYRKRSSIERSMSLTSGRTALKPLSTGGRRSGSAASAGIEMIFFTAHLSPSRYQVQIDDERSFRLMTQLTKPCGLVGSWAGRNSKKLVFFAKIDLLQVFALGEVPEMQTAAVFAAQQQPIFESVRRSRIYILDTNDTAGSAMHSAR